MSRNPYLAASRPTSSFTRSSRTSSKRSDPISSTRSGVGSALLGRSRSSATLGNLSNQLGLTGAYSSSYVPTSSLSRLSGGNRFDTSPASSKYDSSGRGGGSSSENPSDLSRPSLYRSTSSSNLANEAKNDAEDLNSNHLKNYQQSKLQQQNPTTIQGGRSRSPVDTDNKSNSSYTKTRSTTSLNSSATDTSFDDQQFGDSNARHARPQMQPLLKSQSFEVNRQKEVGEPDATPLLSSSMSVDRLLSRAESMGEKDLRKSFKELVMENEKLRHQLMGIDEREKQKHQDWLRKERQLQRKISELEEENRQIEQWKLEIQRLKDENSSLIRVVSKLSKQQ